MRVVLVLTTGLTFLATVISRATAVTKPISTTQEGTSTNLQNPITEWPSLQFDFTVKRSSMKIHSSAVFSIIADPVVSIDGDYVLYDSFTTFTAEGITHNYNVVNGTGYYSSSNVNDPTFQTTSKCLELDSIQLPSINTIASAVNEATPISRGSNGMNCSNGHLFQIVVNNVDFALCTSGSGFTMYGSDIDVSVKYLQTVRNNSSLTFISGTLSECGKTEAGNVVTSTGKALLTGRSTDFGASRNLKAEFDFFDFVLGKDSSSCSCKSKPRPCIFIHGMGVQAELPENQDYSQYWGDLAGHIPCCTEMKFTVLDTINNAWTDNTQQQKVCDRVLAVSQTSVESMIADTIIVAHSMGNLMLAGAIATGKCNLASSSTWIALAAPMKGSKASDFLQESCAGDTNFILKGLTEISGKCPPAGSVKSMPYEGESHSTPELDAAFKAAQDVYRTKVFAVMCSENFSGLVSFEQPWLWTLGTIAHHHSSKNDGMVEFESCAGGLPEAQFGTSWRDRFYKTKLNHNDMRFKHGDSMFNEDQMPVKWFECLL